MFYVPGLMLKDGEFLSPAGVQFRTVKLGGDAFLELSQRKETPAGSYLLPVRHALKHFPAYIC